PLSWKTYAAPVPGPTLVLALGASIAAVSPLNDTPSPKRSPATPSLASSFACSLQVVPLLVNTYAAPASTPAAVSFLRSPTTTVSSSIDTFLPKKSAASVSDGASFACKLQTAPLR